MKKHYYAKRVDMVSEGSVFDSLESAIKDTTKLVAATNISYVIYESKVVITPQERPVVTFPLTDEDIPISKERSIFKSIAPKPDFKSKRVEEEEDDEEDREVV